MTQNTTQPIVRSTTLRYVNPPHQCDVCRDDIHQEFSDARLVTLRVWANICPACADEFGVRYGTGLGQRYTKSADGHFYKVEG